MLMSFNNHQNINILLDMFKFTYYNIVMVKVKNNKVILTINKCSHILSVEEAQCIHKKMGRILYYMANPKKYMIDYSYELKNNEVEWNDSQEV